MRALYGVAAGLGTVLILAQLLGGSFGFEHDGDEVHVEDDGGHGLHIGGLRSIAVGLAAFGFTGLILNALGFWFWMALPLALAVGGAGLLATGWVLMRVARLEEDASVRIADSLGERATVYIPIAPGAAGKIQVTAKGRTVEYRAVAAEPLPTGTAVLITGLQDEETVEVERA